MDLQYQPVDFHTILRKQPERAANPSAIATIKTHSTQSSMFMPNLKPKVVPLNYFGISTTRPLFPDGAEVKFWPKDWKVPADNLGWPELPKMFH